MPWDKRSWLIDVFLDDVFLEELPPEGKKVVRRKSLNARENN